MLLIEERFNWDVIYVFFGGFKLNFDDKLTLMESEPVYCDLLKNSLPINFYFKKITDFQILTNF